MRVLLLIDSLKVGGAERQVVADAQGLAERGVEVAVGYFQPGPLVEQLPPMVRPLPLSDSGVWNRFRSLYQVCRRERFDLIHAHMMTANFYGTLVGRLLHVPVLITEHGMGLWWKPKHLWVARFYFGLSTRAYAVCEATRQVKQYQDRWLAPRLRVMYNSFATTPQTVSAAQLAALRDTYALPSSAPVIGFVGRLEPVKRLDLLVRIARAVTAEHPDAVFLLVGEGSARAGLEAQVQHAGLTETFRFVGFQEQVVPFLALMDLFVLTSEREALSLALLEAAAQGLPAVVFDVGGNREVVSSGETGFVVRFPDTTAFAAQLNLLLKQPEQRRQMGERARERVQRLFSPSHRRDVLMQEYREVLQR